MHHEKNCLTKRHGPYRHPVHTTYRDDVLRQKGEIGWKGESFVCPLISVSILASRIISFFKFEHFNFSAFLFCQNRQCRIRSIRVRRH